MPGPGPITELLRRREGGDRQAEEELFRQVYERLHQMAARRLRTERPDHTLQPTALIHEAYLALIGGATVKFNDRMHFYAVAARIMRRILIDHARQRAALRRPGNQQRVDMIQAQIFSLDDPEFILSLDKALERLREQSERACKVVELHTFAGFQLDQIASSLGVSTRTIRRDWQVARLWIYRELYGT
jgi:RNA polymerase sigma factor (TIGR02999 family)